MRKIGLILLSICLLPCLTAKAAGNPAARFELASVPQVSQAVSRLGDCIAPRFRDTAAGVTLVLTMGAAQYGMDLTRPLEISFYAFGEKPAIRMTAYALQNAGTLREKVKLWGILFRVKRRKQLVILDSENLAEPFPVSLPGKNLAPGELIRGTIRPAAIPPDFKFGHLNRKDHSARLLLNGLDAFLSETKRADIRFFSEESMLKVKISAVPREDSSLQQWMKRPLPPKGRIETFSDARVLAVLRLNPTDTLRRYGQAFLEEGKPIALLPVLVKSANGFAAVALGSFSSGRDFDTMRLVAGIRPEWMTQVRMEILKQNPTPFSGWYRVRKNPPLLCSPTADQAAFFGVARMDDGNVRALLEPQGYQGKLPDCPFICLDLNRPDAPLAELRIEQKTGLLLTLQAPDDWFASRRPLLEKPLLLPDKKTGRP